ncbi:hypothetical protein D3C87_1492260 [compost metagenome]
MINTGTAGVVATPFTVEIRSPFIAVKVLVVAAVNAVGVNKAPPSVPTVIILPASALITCESTDKPSSLIKFIIPVPIS